MNGCGVEKVSGKHYEAHSRHNGADASIKITDLQRLRVSATADQKRTLVSGSPSVQLFTKLRRNSREIRKCFWMQVWQKDASGNRDFVLCFNVFLVSLNLSFSQLRTST